MPLFMADPGMPIRVVQIRGKEETRRFLESLGFVSGSVVTVIAENGGNLIVNIRESRVAISRAMASKIFVS